MIILEKKKGWKVTSLSWKLFNNKLEAEKTKSKENRTVGAKMYETETNTQINNVERWVLKTNRVDKPQEKMREDKKYHQESKEVHNYRYSKDK